MTKINPEFTSVIEKYGAVDFKACYNCGNCTAVCPLVEEENSSFPRRMLRYTLLGLEDDLKTSLDPWMCYYCGDCSETCPRQSNPGEMMMSLRRYLISIYDWTGLSKFFLTSIPALISAFAFITVFVLAAATYYDFKLEPLMHFGHTLELILVLSVASLILVPNIIRMFYFTILKEKRKIPIKLYVTKFWDFILHMATQKKSLICEDAKFRWIEHWLTVFGYLTLLVITVFLDWFATGNKVIVYSGYIVSALVFIFTFDFIFGRIRKNKEINKYSHSSDWLFVIWLFLMGFSAFLVRLFLDLNILENNLWLYLIHLMILAQWGSILVPFGKWTHFLYRPFAIYFLNLKNSAEAIEAKNKA